MTSNERIDRLERAVAQLTGGVDWSAQRGGRDSAALREIVAGYDEAEGAGVRQRRRQELEVELAGLGEAA